MIAVNNEMEAAKLACKANGVIAATEHVGDVTTVFATRKRDIVRPTVKVVFTAIHAT